MSTRRATDDLPAPAATADVAGVDDEHVPALGSVEAPEVPVVPEAPAERAAEPGRSAKGAAKREAILDAALPVFGRVGFHGATLREVARRCGVSHQSLMHYFPTKDALLMAVLRRRDERLRSHFHDAGGMGLGALLSLAEYNVDVPAVIALFSTASAEATGSEHPAHDYYADYYAQIVASTTAWLRPAERRGWLREGFTAESAARVVLAAVDGLQLQWLYDREVRVVELLRLVVATLVTVPLDRVDDAVRTDLRRPPED